MVVGINVAVGTVVAGASVAVGADVAVITIGCAVAGVVAVGSSAASIVILATTVLADSVRIKGISGVGGTTTVGVLQPTRMSKSEAKRS